MSREIKKRKVVSWANMPTKYPAWQTITMWLFLDRTDAPGVIQGVLWTIIALMWVAAIYWRVTEEQDDVKFNDE